MKKIILMLVLVLVGVVSAEEQTIESIYPPFLQGGNLPVIGQQRFKYIRHMSPNLVFDKKEKKYLLLEQCFFGGANLVYAGIPESHYAGIETCKKRIARANEEVLKGNKVEAEYRDDAGATYMLMNLLQNVDKIKDNKWHLLSTPYVNKTEAKILFKKGIFWGYENGKWIYYTDNFTREMCASYDNIQCSDSIKSGGIWFKRKVNDN